MHACKDFWKNIHQIFILVTSKEWIRANFMLSKIFIFVTLENVTQNVFFII